MNWDSPIDMRTASDAGDLHRSEPAAHQPPLPGNGAGRIGPVGVGLSVHSEVISARDLSPNIITQWCRLQASSSELCSPFFSPGFTQAVGRQRDDLFVLLLWQGGSLAGLLPFHRKPGGRGAPVGGQICDYQGVIAAPDFRLDAGELFEASGLRAFDYNHALSSQMPFATGAFWYSASPRVELRAGLDAWRAEVTAHSSALKTLERKRRKIARELGELTFVLHDSSSEAWQHFIEWKSKALADQGVSAFLAEPWLAALFEDLRNRSEPDFGGYFSTLYAGGRLVAAHFGMRSDRAWHWWFPTYDPGLGNYSPGLILMLHCIEAAAAAGLDELDFGRGSERYKREFSNRSRALCEGSLEAWASPWGMTRATRKSAQRLANRLLPARGADFARRAGNKLLRAGLI